MNIFKVAKRVTVIKYFLFQLEIFLFLVIRIYTLVLFIYGILLNEF